MWIARDKDGELYLYSTKPLKCSETWKPHNSEFTRIHDDSFTELKWEDSEPTQVELVIKEK